MKLWELMQARTAALADGDLALAARLEQQIQARIRLIGGAR